MGVYRVVVSMDFTVILVNLTRAQDIVRMERVKMMEAPYPVIVLERSILEHTVKLRIILVTELIVMVTVAV
tara:strand:- start:1092 stop:1304 length:213 start_codon:yes stop_codon:yes gene_type:complete